MLEGEGTKRKSAVTYDDVEERVVLRGGSIYIRRD